MVNVLKFRTLIAYPKGIDKQRRPRSDCSLIRFFPVCVSEKPFVRPKFYLRTERENV